MARVASVKIKFNENISKKLAGAGPNVKSEAARILSTEAASLEAYMKLNRPWTDRTGNARAGLRAEVEGAGTERPSIVLSHSVYYGVYLEYAMEQRFAIINPTIRSQGHRVVQAFEGTIGRLLA